VKTVILSLLLLTAACRNERPPAPTAQQSEQLNDAEQMLNAMAENQAGPEQRPGPSNPSE
jgi:hypothetical protein